MKKISVKDVIFNDFFGFLQSIQEDTPIPSETKYIYFIVDFSNNDIDLSYSADERIFEIFDYGWYFPLDAQHFWSPHISKLAIELFDKKSITKNEVIEMLKEITFFTKKKCNFLKNYTTFFGERFTKIYK